MRGRGELRPVLQRVGADRVVVLLGVAVGLGQLLEPLERVLDVGAELGEEGGDLVGARRSACDSSRTETGTVASSELDGQLAAVLEVGAQRTAGDRQDDVVDGGAGGLLDRLDVVEAHVGERRSSGGR